MKKRKRGKWVTEKGWIGICQWNDCRECLSKKVWTGIKPGFGWGCPYTDIYPATLRYKLPSKGKGGRK